MRIDEQATVDQQGAFDPGGRFDPIVAQILLPAQKFESNDGRVVKPDDERRFDSFSFPECFDEVRTLYRTVRIIDGFVEIAVPYIFNEELRPDSLTSQMLVDFRPSE